MEGRKDGRKEGRKEGRNAKKRTNRFSMGFWWGLHGCEELGGGDGSACRSARGGEGGRSRTEKSDI